MSVIRPEMITKDITRRDLLPLSFLKMSAYTGSKRGLRYKLEKCVARADTAGSAGEAKVEAAAETVAEAVPDGGTVTVLRCRAWTGGLCSDCTPEEEMTIRDFEFSDGGIDAAILWLNGQLEALERE